MSDKKVTITFETDMNYRELHHVICDALDASDVEWIVVESDPEPKETDDFGLVVERPAKPDFDWIYDDER